MYSMPSTEKLFPMASTLSVLPSGRTGGFSIMGFAVVVVSAGVVSADVVVSDAVVSAFVVVSV